MNVVRFSAPSSCYASEVADSPKTTTGWPPRLVELSFFLSNETTPFCLLSILQIHFGPALFAGLGAKLIMYKFPCSVLSTPQHGHKWDQPPPATKTTHDFPSIRSSRPCLDRTQDSSRGKFRTECWCVLLSFVMRPGLSKSSVSVDSFEHDHRRSTAHPSACRDTTKTDASDPTAPSTLVFTPPCRPFCTSRSRRRRRATGRRSCPRTS